MPTDTVYVLVAACNRPQAVEKAYRSVTLWFHVPVEEFLVSVAPLVPLVIICDNVLSSCLCRVKKQAKERPMSLWISSIKQLEPVRQQISPVLWDFMEAAWPSSISLVIARGEYT